MEVSILYILNDENWPIDFRISVLFLYFIVYGELEATGKFERMSMKVDEDEHSIEMQLPYIAKVMQE